MRNSNLLLKFDYYFPRILIVTAVFYFFKNAFWPLTYLFIAGYASSWILFFLKCKCDFGLLGFLKLFHLAIVLLILIVIAFILSKKYSDVFLLKTVLRVFILFSICYLVYWSVIIKDQNVTRKFVYNIIIITTFVIAVLNLLKVIFLSSFSSVVFKVLHISDGISISNDNNFFSLFMLFGLIIVSNAFPTLKRELHFSKFLSIILSLVFILNILLLASRRGIFVLIILLLFFFIKSLISEIKNFNKKKFLLRIIVFSLSIALFFSIGIIVVKVVPRETITMIVYRYASLVGMNNYKNIERILWSKKEETPSYPNILIDRFSFERQPEYWISTADGTTLSQVSTPYGVGYQISRDEGMGSFSLKYDGPDIIYYAHHSYKISYKIKFINGDFDSYKLGWWISDAGRGAMKTSNLDKKYQSLGNGWYQCNAVYTFNDNHIGITGFINSVEKGSELIITDWILSDLDYSSELPKFVFEKRFTRNLENWLDQVNPPVYNDTSLINNGDFSNGLKYWSYNADSLTVELDKLDGKNCVRICRGDGDGSYWSLCYVGRDIPFVANNKYEISLKIKPVSPKKISFNIGFWVNEGMGFMYNLKPQIDSLTNGWLQLRVNYKFIHDQKDIGFGINSQIDNSEFYVTDIVLKNQTQSQRIEIQLDTEKKSSIYQTLLVERTSRWLYAIELWKTKYKWWNKLFGNGFKYLHWYGEKFFNDVNRYDWPHNPFITVLLYSGILGLIIYIFFLFKVFYLYIKYNKDYGLIFVCFLISSFFAFFSGESPFDPPIVGFFVLAPFFIDCIAEKRESG